MFPDMDYLSQVQLESGWQLQRYSTVDSTNLRLAQLARHGTQEGFCISTDHQSAGKGRLGRIWQDSPGKSLLLSILCRPQFKLEDFFAVTCALSVSAVEAIDALGVQGSIKWPNDVLVGMEKLAGILAESGEDSSGRYLVVGIGVNLNQNFEDLASLKRPAVSLGALLGREISASERESLELDLLNRFRTRYLSIQDNFSYHFAELLAAYRSRCSTLNSFVRVVLNDGESISGNVLDISNQGHLLVELDTCIRSISAGEVEHLYR